MAKQPNSVSSGGESFMVKLATFIVDKRNLFFLITIILVIFSMFSRGWVEVENDLTFYLPEDSETKKALNVMEGEFTTYGTAEVMVANISYADAESMLDDLKEIRGVQSISFDDTTDHYNNASALFSITFDYDETDDACMESLDKVKEYLSGQDVYVKTDLGNAQAETIEREINMIMVYVAVVIVAVLLFTSETFGEVPVLILTFGVGLIVNQGTNYLLGKISFVSNSVTSILQLGLSIDYAIIFCNRFKEEHKTLPIREAVILALSKAIPEIGASSLTTIGGLVAMLFMQFKLGPDMAICLIKSIGFALLSAFVVMPGLLMLFGPLIDRTGHKSFVPKIPFVGAYDYATRHIVPIIFVVVLFFAFRLSNNCPYAYGYSVLTTPKLNETQIAKNMIEDNFSSSNMMALVVPKGDYEKEAQLLKELESYDEVDYTMGLANVDALDGYKLADKLTPRQFAELAGLDYEAAQVVYAAYAAENESYGELVGNIATYKVPLIDMFLYVCDKVDSGIVTLSDEQTDMLHEAQVQMQSARNQLQGDTYSRMLIYLTLPVSGDETYKFTDKILEIARSYYPDEDVYLAGDSTNEYDFEKSFAVDNTVVSIVSVLIVLVVLLFKLILGDFGPAGSNKSYPVPDIRGKTVEEAQEMEGVKDIFLIEVQGTRTTEEYQPGQIVEQDPAAGRTRKSNLVIQVYVAAEPEKVPMKDLVGMEYRQARVLLTDMGLDLKITTETVSSDKYGADAVIETVPVADEPLVAGQTVILRVSTGPETVTVPTFTGQDIANAVQNAQDLGLTVGEITYDTFSFAPQGQVIEQSIKPTNEVPGGTKISFTVSGQKNSDDATAARVVEFTMPSDMEGMIKVEFEQDSVTLDSQYINASMGTVTYTFTGKTGTSSNVCAVFTSMNTGATKVSAIQEIRF